MDSRTMLCALAVAVLTILAAATAWFEIPVVETMRLCADGEAGRNAVRFALVTDLHSCRYGARMEKLVKLIDDARPDAILLAGDIFDDKRPNTNTRLFLEQIAPRYKCFYATGNHEFMARRVRKTKAYLRKIGITVLAGDCAQEKINGRFFDICGVDDPEGLRESAWLSQLERAYEKTNREHCRILLSHRPERVETYSRFGFNIVVAGHAHGGQWLLPFANRGVIAPDQGLFPKYVSGLHTLPNGTSLVVSRGLAREKVPLPRFGNHPEVVILEL